MADRSLEGGTGAGRLLGAADPPPVSVVNPQGASPFLLIGDHAGNHIPAALGDLGLDAADRTRHIAWDIGTAVLGAALAARLDAVFLHQPYSRLVIDCNRDPHAADAVPPASDGSPIPGNTGLGPAARAERIAQIHAPYQAAIGVEIARRDAAGQETVLVSLHSFTTALAGGAARPWDIGILHDGHADGFARRLLALLAARGDLVVGDNEPYRMDSTDHSVPRHAFPARAYAEIEIAQRSLGDAAAAGRWTEVLAPALGAALRGGG